VNALAASAPGLRRRIVHALANVTKASAVGTNGSAVPGFVGNADNASTAWL
jgi:hypothetical protein